MPYPPAQPKTDSISKVVVVICLPAALVARSVPVQAHGHLRLSTSRPASEESPCLLARRYTAVPLAATLVVSGTACPWKSSAVIWEYQHYTRSPVHNPR
jgi:hypothetical protein